MRSTQVCVRERERENVKTDVRWDSLNTFSFFYIFYDSLFLWITLRPKSALDNEILVDPLAFTTLVSRNGCGRGIERPT